MGFLNRNLNFFEIAKGGKFAVVWVSNVNISQKCLFCPIYDIFSTNKYQKTFKVGKMRKYDEEGVFLREKNVFIFLKAFFTKMGRRKICR